jgi:hypothetical protein
MIKLSVRLPGDHDNVFFHQPIAIDQAVIRCLKRSLRTVTHSPRPERWGLGVFHRGASSVTVPAQS